MSTPRPPRLHRAAVLLGTAVLATTALAACGSNSLGPSSQGGSSATTGTKDAALAAKVPAKIKSAGTIIVGTDSTYAPNEFLDTDGKTVIGMDVDLFNAVAAKLGVKAQFQSASFDSIISGVDGGKYDVGVSSFTINTDRKSKVNMVSYFTAGTEWAVKKGNPAGVKPDSACGKRVAVQQSTTQADDDLPKKQKACTDAGKPGMEIQQYESQADATNAVISGKADAMLADSPVCAYAIKQTNGQLEQAGSIYDSAPYGIVVPKSETDFAQAIAGGFSDIIKDGTYAKILAKWGNAGGKIDTPAVNP